MFTLNEWSARMGDVRIKEIADMLSQRNDDLELLFGPIADMPRPTYTQRLRSWVGLKLVNLGCSIMGDDAPTLE